MSANYSQMVWRKIKYKYILHITYILFILKIKLNEHGVLKFLNNKY